MKNMIFFTLLVFAGLLIKAQPNPHVPQLISTKKCVGCDLSNTNLKEANLAGADISGAWLHSVNLRGANLAGANLKDAKLINVNLKKANLQGVILAGATMVNIALDGSDLKNANLERVCIIDVSCDERTVLPTGFFCRNNKLFIDYSAYEAEQERLAKKGWG